QSKRDGRRICYLPITKSSACLCTDWFPRSDYWYIPHSRLHCRRKTHRTLCSCNHRNWCRIRAEELSTKRFSPFFFKSSALSRSDQGDLGGKSSFHFLFPIRSKQIAYL